jgi:hypothetical protein
LQQGLLCAIYTRILGAANTDDCGDLIKVSFGLSQLAIDNAQASNRQAHVDIGCFNEAVGNFDG